MLPSTGLFKAINCPYFDNGSCTRPFCHFKHVKKDEEPKILAKPQIVTYNPTPIAILEKSKSQNIPTPQPPEPVITKKKPKLEYVPLPTKKSSRGTIPSVTYIPSAINEENLESNLDNCMEELDLIADIFKSENEPDEPNGCTKNEHQSPPQNVPDPEPKTIEKPVYIPTKIITNVAEKSPPPLADKKLDDNLPSTEQKEKSEKSSSSSSRHHKSSSSSSRHSSSSKSKERDKDRHRSSSSSHRSSTSSKTTQSGSHRRSSGSSSSSKSNHKKDSSKSTSSSSRDHREKRSSTFEVEKTSKTSSHKRKESSTTDPKKSKLPPPSEHTGDLENESYSGLVSPSSIFDTDSSDEDEIMKQCKMIFDEFRSEPSVATTSASTGLPSTLSSPTQTNGTTSKLEEINLFDESAAKKRRVAHESNNLPVRKLPQHLSKPNHVQNAMQSIYLRQEAMKRQLEEARALSEVAPVALEEKPTAINSIKPPVESNTNNPFKPNSRIGPVSNVIALQLAKQKIEMLKAKKAAAGKFSKPSVSSASSSSSDLLRTQAQTSKFTGRVAHVNAKQLDVDKPAPPILEPSSNKISYNIRMQYYNLIVKHCLNIYPNCEDAWDRAQTEELAVMKKCSTPVIYKNSALLVVNKLRKESIDAGNINTEKNKTISHDVILAGRAADQISWDVNKKKGNRNTDTCILDIVSEAKAYELVAECIMTDAQLIENGYPRPGERPGQAIVNAQHKPKTRNENERFCVRCSKQFHLDSYEEHAIDQCNYHPKGTGFRRGFADNLHRCCQQPAGTPGCMYANYHVTDYVDYGNLSGFVTTMDKDESYVPTKKDIFGLDCEMCYTTDGFELTRVTVVDINEKIVFDSLVKPDNKIVDYNTTYSGITEPMLKNIQTNLRGVQAILLSMFHSKSILIGHSLESDLKALKIIHSVVVDTSILYPHKMGPPKKRALKNLSIENLKKIIQEDEGGHDSSEDARACIGLVKHYLKYKIV